MLTSYYIKCLIFDKEQSSPKFCLNNYVAAELVFIKKSHLVEKTLIIS